MATPNNLIGNWKPVTDGEKLFHFLARNVGEFRALDQLRDDVFTKVMRGRQFMRFAEGAIVLHCFGRLLQAAKWYRQESYDDLKASAQILEFATDTLGISRATCASFSALAPSALAAAKAASLSSASPNSSEKKAVIKGSRNDFNCYSCGRILNPEVDATSEAYLEFDHIWPHSFGGNSIAANLLPACTPCNRNKGNITSWEWSPVQSILPEYIFRSKTFSGPAATRSLKIGLHIRVAIEYARANGSTLKDAYIAIGPRLDEIEIIDLDDTADFFNLRVHDPKETEINWEH